MDKHYSFITMFDDMKSIRCSYARRVNFCRHEIHKLKLDYENSIMNEYEYFQKLCPLNREKNNINLDYKEELSSYIKTIPEKFFSESMISQFNKNLL